MTANPIPSSLPHPPELRQLALYWLCESEPLAKAAGVQQLRHDYLQGALQLDSRARLQAHAGEAAQNEFARRARLDDRRHYPY